MGPQPPCSPGFSLTGMAIDFTLPPDVEAVRQRTREFVGQETGSLQSALGDLTR